MTQRLMTQHYGPLGLSEVQDRMDLFWPRMTSIYEKAKYHVQKTMIQVD